MVRSYLPDNSLLFCPIVQSLGAFPNFINLSLSKGGLFYIHLRALITIKACRNKNWNTECTLNSGWGSISSKTDQFYIQFHATADIHWGSLGFQDHHFTPFQQRRSQHKYIMEGHIAPNFSFSLKFNTLRFSIVSFKGCVKGTT